MNRADLVNHVADTASLTKTVADKAVSAVFDAITAALGRGEEVSVLGFGGFSVTERAARQGRNPQTGATIEIAASRAPTFKAGKRLKDAVNS
jgi:DNA-binding protein HU-beta